MHTTLSIFLFRWWWVLGKGGEGSRSISGVEFAVICTLLLVLLLVLYLRISSTIEKVSSAKVVLPKQPLSDTEKNILSTNSRYFASLTASQKLTFEKRVKHFLVSKLITVEDGYGKLEEMSVLIAAAATQLGFGLPASANSNNSHFLVIPEASFTPRSATKSTVVIPWKEFQEGFAITDDGKNDGLYRLAIAMIKDDRTQADAYKLFPAKKLQAWKKAALKEAPQFMGGLYSEALNNESVFDEYFAQAIVYFVELPGAFNQKYPSLYLSLANLVGQNPVNKTIRS